LIGYWLQPWGKVWLYGLPGDAITLSTRIISELPYHYPLNGALVDGPVYGSIYNRLKGLRLMLPDQYADFQSDLVYITTMQGGLQHNDPPWMGTASLIYLWH